MPSQDHENGPGPRPRPTRQGLPSGLFRAEALEYFVASRPSSGEPLRISPHWSGWAYRLLLLVAVTAAIFVSVARSGEYASGPAVIRLGGRIDVTVSTPGVVNSLDVQAGDAVQEGQALAHLEASAEAGELQRAEKEFEIQLIQCLKDPSDQVARRTLPTLRSQRDYARARLDARTLRAQRAGLVNAIHVKRGQNVVPGETVFSMTAGIGPARVIAMLPGRYRPQLRPGMNLQFEMSGYEQVRRDALIEVVGEEVIGPQAARRLLGPDISDAVVLSGPVVVVQARLPSSQFSADGQVLHLHDGMFGSGEVRVRSESVLLALVPGLKRSRGPGG